MVSVSCFNVHVRYNYEPVSFLFIEYEKFIKIHLKYRKVILTKNQLVSNVKLFQIYKLSLLCTEDSSSVIKIKRLDKISYGICTMRYWKSCHFKNYYDIVEIEKDLLRDPLISMEPKRATSNKKIKKFERLFESYIINLIIEPKELISEFIKVSSGDVIGYFTKYIQHEVKINILSRILHNYGKDVYYSVKKFV